MKKVAEIQFIPVGRAKDLTNMVFGRWKVLGRAQSPNGSNKQSYWWCQCSCSNQTIQIVRADQLTRGISSSCGCYAKEKAFETGKKNYHFLQENPANNKEDLTDQVFSFLKVLEDTNKRQKAGSGTSVIWKCKCLLCNNITEVSAGHLKSEHTTSCGCRKRSIGEQTIYNLLVSANIPFEEQYLDKQYQFKDTGYYPKFDFFVNKQYYIEYDGEQHFDCKHHGWNNETEFLKTQQRDDEKNIYCLKSGIPLIRIPYTHLSNICLNDLLLETSEFIYKGENNE